MACDEGYTIQVLMLQLFMSPTLKMHSKSMVCKSIAVLPLTALHMHCQLLYEAVSKEVQCGNQLACMPIDSSTLVHPQL